MDEAKETISKLVFACNEHCYRDLNAVQVILGLSFNYAILLINCRCFEDANVGIRFEWDSFHNILLLSWY